jgi:hypothetical protein
MKGFVSDHTVRGHRVNGFVLAFMSGWMFSSATLGHGHPSFTALITAAVMFIYLSWREFRSAAQLRHDEGLNDLFGNK